MPTCSLFSTPSLKSAVCILQCTVPSLKSAFYRLPILQSVFYTDLLNIYLLLTEFEGRTVNYGNEVSKIFIINISKSDKKETFQFKW